MSEVHAPVAPGPVMILAGGTGGHVFPALAVAERLRDWNVPVVWMGTRRGLEARVVPSSGIPMEWIAISGLRRKGGLAWLAAPLRLGWACLQAGRRLRARRPAAVLGMGGFVTGPGGLMAAVMRRPLVVHEQNAVVGLTNRWLARIADRVLEAFPGSFGSGARAQVTGNPVRRAIAETDSPHERLAGRRGPVRMLVLGGSQGARALNEVLPPAVALLEGERRPRIWHQSGITGLEPVREAYAAAGVEARVEAFIEDMAEAYAWADLVVARAGALTVAELAAVGVASILVPYPYAVDNHQTGNARYLSRAGAALLLPQPALTPRRLAAALAGLSAQGETLLAMAEAARGRAWPDAAERVARACLEAAGAAWPPPLRSREEGRG